MKFKKQILRIILMCENSLKKFINNKTESWLLPETDLAMDIESNKGAAIQRLETLRGI